MVNIGIIQKTLSVYTPEKQKGSGVALIVLAVILGSAIGVASAGWAMVAVAVLGIALVALANCRAHPNKEPQVPVEEGLSKRRIELLFLKNPLEIEEPELFESVRKLDFEAVQKQVQEIDPRDRRRVLKEAVEVLPSEESDLFKVMYPEEIQKEFEKTTAMRNFLKRDFL